MKIVEVVKRDKRALKEGLFPNDVLDLEEMGRLLLIRADRR